MCIFISASLRRPHWQLSNSPRIARPVLGQNLWLDTTYILGANDVLSPLNPAVNSPIWIYIYIYSRASERSYLAMVIHTLKKCMLFVFIFFLSKISMTLEILFSFQTCELEYARKVMCVCVCITSPVDFKPSSLCYTAAAGQ